MSKKRFYETDTFKAEQAEWYDKLADDGFEDIELMDPTTGSVSSRFLRGNISSTVTIENNPELEDGQKFPEGLDHFHITPKMHRYTKATEAMNGILNDPSLTWEQKMACAMYAEGFDQQEIADDLGTTRRRVRRLVLPLKDILEGKVDEDLTD
jgi:hypothetical protein